MRQWEDAVNNPESPISKHPSDYALCELGTFDDESGELQQHIPVHVLASALDTKHKPKQNTQDLFNKLQQQA